MAWIDDVGYVEDEIPKPASYEEQVAYARQIGVPENEITSVVGTPESVAANSQIHAQTIYEATGQAPSWSQDVGYVPPPPAWLNPADYVSEGFSAPYTREEITGQIDPSRFRTMNGQLYASAKSPSDLSGGEYLIDPNTGRFILDASGNPVGVTYPARSSGFHDYITTPRGALTTGAAIMGALYGGTALLDAYGAGAGTFGLTAKSIPAIAPELALPGTILPGAAPSTFGSIVAPSLATGLGVGAGGVLGGGALSAETVALMEAMKAGTGYGLNASQVPNLAQGLELAAPSGLTGIDSLLSSLGSALKTPLGQLGARGGLSLLAGGGAQQAATPQVQAGSGTYAPKGQVDYTPILNLLAPRQIARNTNSLLG